MRSMRQGLGTMGLLLSFALTFGCSGGKAELFQLLLRRIKIATGFDKYVLAVQHSGSGLFPERLYI